MVETSVGSPLLWAGFAIFVLVMLALDLGVFNRKVRETSFRQALAWTIFCVGCAVAFNIGIYFWTDSERALEFLTGYLVEEALSVDNLFVFLLIFSYFKVPKPYQHRVLFYGVLGAVVMRGLFIFLGAALISRFHWILYIFGGILVVSAFKLVGNKQEDIDPESNFLIRLFQRLVPITSGFRDEKFFVRENGKLYATRLCLVLVSVEVSDLIFAVDSIPAIFAITTDPFIILTSNIFAILGLRAMYFVLACALSELRFLNYGLAIVLGFVGIKMLVSGFYKIPIGTSLIIIASAIGLSVLFSLRYPKAEEDKAEEEKKHRETC